MDSKYDINCSAAVLRRVAEQAGHTFVGGYGDMRPHIRKTGEVADYRPTLAEIFQAGAIVRRGRTLFVAEMP
jgi:hypothetical protein